MPAWALSVVALGRLEFLPIRADSRDGELVAYLRERFAQQCAQSFAFCSVTHHGHDNGCNDQRSMNDRVVREEGGIRQHRNDRRRTCSQTDSRTAVIARWPAAGLEILKLHNVPFGGCSFIVSVV